MAFSPSVHQDALVSAVRHCCVCRRYKGVKIEVYHPVSPANGGSEEPDNAVALCFDCHADAGRYHPGHPRGAKFSPAALRQAHDSWHTLVKADGIQSPQIQDWAYARYLICKSFSALADAATIWLPRCAPQRARDPRSPQNLLPIGALERKLKVALGDARLVKRWIETLTAKEAIIA